MSTIVDRDWTQQEKFGKDLQEFENNMRTCSRYHDMEKMR